MRAKRIVLFCLAGVLGGCISIPSPLVSLNPLFTKETIVFDEKLLGTWIGDTNDPGESWELARFEESSVENLPKELRSESKRIYRVNYTDREGHKGALVACMVKLGDRRFVDLFADQFPSGESDPNNMKLPSNEFFFLPIHWLLRVDVMRDQLKLKIPLTQYNEFEKLLGTEPKPVAYAEVQGTPVLTAPSKELQAFLTKYADDKRLFAEELTLVRKNK